MAHDLSIVIPVYSNAQSLEKGYLEIKNSLSQFLPELSLEFIYVDDGSKDESLAILSKMVQSEPNIKIIKLSKNYGQPLAVLAGFEHASGKYAVMIAADNQDPPELIVQLYEKAILSKLQVVIGQRVSREDSFYRKYTGYLFNFLVRKFAIHNMPLGGFDVMILHRKVYQLITKHAEKSPYTQGQVLWPGFKMGVIPYSRRERKEGRSQWTFSKKLSLFWDVMVGYSFMPLQVITLVGVLLSFASFFYAGVVLISKLFLNASMPLGWAPLIITILLVSGVQMIMIGIIGQYMRRIYDEIRNRPAFIVDEIIAHETFGPDKIKIKDQT